VGGVVDALEHGGGQHDKCGCTEPDATVADRDKGGAGEGHETADPASRGGTLAEQCGGEQDAVDGSRRDQQAGGTGRHDSLAGVEQQLIAGHTSGAAQGDQRQIPGRGAAYTHERGGDGQRERGDQEPRHAQARRAELRHGDPDSGEGAGPQDDGDGES
jgi:hypothetical protein